MIKLAWIFTGIFGLGLSACSSLDTNAMTDARLISPSADTHIEITAAVTTALSGAKVTIASDALTRKSTLIIDPPGSNMPSAAGQIMGRPDHFDLKLSGKRCVLIHRQTGEIYTLKTATCRAVTM
ncbi:MAG: hypothetical protein ACSHXY_13035 [Alphaproteobacteria bacterium]